VPESGPDPEQTFNETYWCNVEAHQTPGQNLFTHLPGEKCLPARGIPATAWRAKPNAQSRLRSPSFGRQTSGRLVLAELSQSSGEG
jgi:hypothetical protein